jgi:hypothetical protein
VLPVLNGQQTSFVRHVRYCADLPLSQHESRSKWKYKLTSIVLAVLMLYMIFCSIKCAAQAASQGGGANQIMLFSVVVTYGCEQVPVAVSLGSLS